NLPWTGLLNVFHKLVTPRPDLFFNRKIGPQRTGRGLKVPLSAFKSLKDHFGCTVNDAVLAVVSEGLHRWFKSRGEAVPEKVRVFCPVSVRGDESRGRGGNQISGMVLELPTGNLPIDERLRRIKVTTGDLKRTRQAIAADKLVGLADWAPPTLLVLAGRLMSNPQAGANINVTNIPGPQFPLYSGGAQLLEDRLAVDQRAVGAAQVADPERAGAHLDAAVAARRGGIRDHHVVVGRSAQGDHLIRKGNDPASEWTRLEAQLGGEGLAGGDRLRGHCLERNRPPAL